MACATLKRSLDFDPVHNGRQTKRQRRCSPLCVSPKSSPSKPVEEQKTPSIFEQGTPALNPERMAADLRDEIRRLQRLNKLQIDSSEDSKDSSSSQDSGPDSPGTSSTVRAPRIERPLYTLQQVEMICERMLREREAELREEYERILHMKLADQYEQFVKFTYDQLHRGYPSNETPSYMS